MTDAMAMLHEGEAVIPKGLPVTIEPLELDEHAAWPMPEGGRISIDPKRPTFKDRASDLVRWVKGER